MVKVSVALTTYNGARFLGAQLQSLAEQMRPPDELIVYDDCSTDSTPQILEQFARSADFPVLIHHNESTAGPAGNFNLAVARCSGDVIALADQDDWWLPDKLALVERAFTASPSIGLVFSNSTLVDDGLNPLGKSGFEAFDVTAADVDRIRHGRAFEVMVRGGIVSGCAMAFRSCYRSILQPFPVTGQWLHDGWIALMVSALADVGIIEQPLILYRQHASQKVGVSAERGLTRLRRIRRPVDRQAFLDARDALNEARARLSASLSADRAALVFPLLDRRLRYLEARASMPARRPQRLPAAAKRLLAADYQGQRNWLGALARDVIS